MTAGRSSDRALKLSGLPQASEDPLAGGAAFVAYCLGGEVRAQQRREAINRAHSASRLARRPGHDPYPAALTLVQRAGVALEDLARLAIALESIGESDPFTSFRAARYADLEAIYDRLAENAEGLRASVRLPDASQTADLSPELRDAVLSASDALARRWSARWDRCASWWLLLHRITKALRHGAPLMPREWVVGQPGVGALGNGVADPFDRWVLLVSTSVDLDAKHLHTETVPADLSDQTLARARHAGLEAVSLARELTGAHAQRVRSESKWALPSDVVNLVDHRHRKVLRAHARNA